MRLCRFGDGQLGLVDGDGIKDVTKALDVLPSCHYPFPTHDILIANLDKVMDRVRAIAPAASSTPIAGMKFLSPVSNPSKVIGAPVNYQKHLDEVKSDAALHHDNQA